VFSRQLLLILLVLFAVGCGSSSEPSQDSEASGDVAAVSASQKTPVKAKKKNRDFYSLPSKRPDWSIEHYGFFLESSCRNDAIGGGGVMSIRRTVDVLLFLEAAEAEAVNQERLEARALGIDMK